MSVTPDDAQVASQSSKPSSPTTSTLGGASTSSSSGSVQLKRALVGQGLAVQQAILKPAAMPQPRPDLAAKSPSRSAGAERGAGEDPAATATARSGSDGPPAATGRGVQRKIHRGEAVQLKAGDVVQREGDPPPPGSPAAAPAGPPPLTQEECTRFARDVETKFGAQAASGGAGLTGAQAMVDAALVMIQTQVPIWNARLTEAQAAGARLDERVRSVDQQVARAMGTPPRTRSGASMASVAGAVPPEKVAAHLQTGTGNLRTKMTAVFNFMSAFSRMVLEEKRSGTTAFFDQLGAQGTALMQTAAQAETRIAEAKARATARGQDPAGVRETILAPAASQAAREQSSTTRPNRPDLAPEATIGTADDTSRSRRMANDASLGAPLTPDEIEFMQLEADRLDEQRLTWREGLDIYAMDQDHWWAQQQNNLGLPIGAGPASGTTDRLMQTGQQLGCAPMATRAACLGYLLSINAHTLVEIMTSAKPYSGEFTEPLDGFAMYKEIKPFGSLRQHANPRFWDEKVDPQPGAAAPGGGTPTPPAG